MHELETIKPAFEPALIYAGATLFTAGIVVGVLGRFGIDHLKDWNNTRRVGNQLRFIISSGQPIDGPALDEMLASLSVGGYMRNRGLILAARRLVISDLVTPQD